MSFLHAAPIADGTRRFFAAKSGADGSVPVQGTVHAQQVVVPAPSPSPNGKGVSTVHVVQRLAPFEPRRASCECRKSLTRVRLFVAHCSSVFPRHRIAKQHTVAAERQDQMQKKTPLEGAGMPPRMPGPRMATPRLATPREPIVTTTGPTKPPLHSGFVERTSYAGVSLGQGRESSGGAGWNPSNTLS